MASPPETLLAYRIADQRHPILDGTGTFMLGSRWISRGRRVIHASESYAASLLERSTDPKPVDWDARLFGAGLTTTRR
jgi:RES domain-containing protein